MKVRGEILIQDITESATIKVADSTNLFSITPTVGDIVIGNGSSASGQATGETIVIGNNIVPTDTLGFGPINYDGIFIGSDVSGEYRGNSLIIGNGASGGTGFSNIAIGAAALATAGGATVLGNGASAAGQDQTVLGNGSSATFDATSAFDGTASGANSIAFSGTASGADSLCLGGDATGDNSTAINTDGIDVSGDGAVAIGKVLSGAAADCVAIGTGASGNSAGKVSIGLNSGSGAVAANQTSIGSNSNVHGKDDVSIGSNAYTDTESVSVGSGTVSVNNGVAIGYLAGNTSSGARGVIVGATANSNSTDGVTIGFGASGSSGGGLTIGLNSTTSNSDFVIAVGANSTGSGHRSICLGDTSQTSGLGSLAIGSSAQATANYAGILSTSDTVRTNSVANTMVIHCDDTAINTVPAFGVRVGCPEIPEYTVATAPASANSRSGLRGLIYVTDESGGATLAVSDGTDWRRVSDGAVIS